MSHESITTHWEAGSKARKSEYPHAQREHKADKENVCRALHKEQADTSKIKEQDGEGQEERVHQFKIAHRGSQRSEEGRMKLSQQNSVGCYWLVG